jgi:hypothetical protein
MRAMELHVSQLANSVAQLPFSSALLAFLYCTDKQQSY